MPIFKFVGREGSVEKMPPNEHSVDTLYITILVNCICNRCYASMALPQQKTPDLALPGWKLSAHFMKLNHYYKINNNEIFIKYFAFLWFEGAK